MSVEKPPKIVAEVIVGGGGPKFFERGKDGPLASYRNAQVALTCMGAVLSFNEFRQRAYVHWHMFGDNKVELSDRRLIVLRSLITERYGFDPTRQHVIDAALAMCEGNSFDPVLDYLDNLRWDGKRRLDTWLSVYLGAENTAYTQDCGRKTLIAGVRRVRQPGCKFDTILTLEGKQGLGKSSALQILAGEPEYFTDQDVLHNFDPRAAQEAVAGKWIVELAELAGLTRTNDFERVKSFASRQFDRARGAYERFTNDQPRRCIMIGTTNADDWLGDPTGNRRWWPIATESVDLQGLRRDRDQLWAEAAAAERRGETLELDSEHYAEAAMQQNARVAYDPWDDKLRDIVSINEEGIRKIFSHEVIGSTQLSLPIERQTPAISRRVAACMRRIGWEGPKMIFIRGEKKRGFWRSNHPSTDYENT